MEILSWRSKQVGLFFAFVCLCLLLPPGVNSARADVSLEYKVKAAFLVNFMKFIEWPAPIADAPVLCVYGDNPFGEYIGVILKSSVAHAKNVLVTDERELIAAGCSVVFSTQGKFGAISAEAPVLTVSDVMGSAGIVFKVIDNKVRFVVNSGILSGRGLKASSKLLALSLRE